MIRNRNKLYFSTIRLIMSLVLLSSIFTSALVPTVKAAGVTPLWNSPGGVQVSDAGMTNRISQVNTSRKLAVTPDGTIYVLFHGDAGIRVAKSTDRGQTFSPSVQVNSSDLDAEIAASSNGNVYVIWSQSGSVYLSKSTDKGATFSAPANIGTANGTVHMDTDDKYVYIIDQRGTNFYYSSDNGNTFTLNTIPTTYAFSDVHVDPSTHQVVIQKDNPSLRYYTSDDYGVTLNGPVDPPGQVFFSVSAISGGELGHYTFVSGQGITAYKYDLINQSLTPLTFGDNMASRSISADSFGNVVTGYSNGTDVSFAVSQDLGATFGSPVTINGTTIAESEINTTNGDILFVYESGGKVYLAVYAGLLQGYGLNVSATTLSFPDQNAPNQIVTLHNTSNRTITMNSITASEPFTVISDCGSTLAPDAQCSLQIGFNPTGAGTFSGKVTIDSDAFSIPRVILLTGASTASRIVLSAPTGLAANAGDGQASLSWNSVTGATYYEIYQGTAPGEYGDSALATVSESTYNYTATGLANGTTYYFAVKAANDSGSSAYSNEVSVTPQVSAPVSPVGLTANAGDGQASLSWNSVTGATYYEIYQGTAPGEYGEGALATVSGSTYSYTATGLTNGITYYFAVKAGNDGGISGYSDEASATPQTVPAAPTDIIAAAGDGQATVAFTAPADNGGSAITGYEVTSSPGNIIATGTASPITLTGLQNGTTYTFTVKAINSAGSSAASAVSNAVTPLAPSSGDGGSTPAEPTAPSILQPTNTGVNAIVNGKVQSIGTATTAKVNNQTVTTVVIDPKKLDDILAAEDQHAVITIPVNTKADVVVGELNGQMVKNMEQKQAVLVIKTENATYTLPAQQININHLSDQLGKPVALQDIKVQIEIAVPTAGTVKTVENAAAKGQFTIVAPPLNFTVRGVYGDAKVEVSKFNAYVERTLAIPDGIDPQKITTGVVIEPDGAVRHVPTKIVNVDGKYFAKVNSLTNSTYSVVWHPLEFKDVAKHWAKDAVNDMGSRMIVGGSGSDMFNPDQDIMRAEFAAIVVRGLGLKPEGNAAPFSDVRQSDWYNDFVQTSYAYHLITGFEDGTFRPNDKITREQAMAIIAKAMTITDLKAKLPSKEAGEVLRPFADANRTSGWAKNSAADCLQAGIISGRNSSQLAPKDNITRAEVAAIIQRLLQKSDLIN